MLHEKVMWYFLTQMYEKGSFIIVMLGFGLEEVMKGKWVWKFYEGCSADLKVEDSCCVWMVVGEWQVGLLLFLRVRRKWLNHLHIFLLL